MSFMLNIGEWLSANRLTVMMGLMALWVIFILIKNKDDINQRLRKQGG